MQSLRSTRPVGIPVWLLWAAVPVVLVLGFVVGVLLAPGPAETKPGGGTKSAATPGAEADAPDTGNASVTKADSSWQIANSRPGSSLAPFPEVPGVNPRTSGSGTGYVSDAPIGKVQDIRDARAALSAEFNWFSVGGSGVRFDYQQMRSAEGGIALVGLVTVADYDNWVKALQSQPEQLNAWLGSAAARVLPATARDRFHLSWAVVDVLRDRPEGFNDDEVTPLENRSYLVVRPLAATVDHFQSVVAVKPLPGRDASQTGPVLSTSPWTAYGPLLRFDGNDLYRPPRTIGTKPVMRSK